MHNPLHVGAFALIQCATTAGCVDCAWRFANLHTTTHLVLAGSAPTDEVSLVVNVLRVETADQATDTAMLTGYGDGEWGLGYEDAAGNAEWSFQAPYSAECQGAYNATWTFSLDLPRKWPPEIAAAHPPLVFNLTRDELYRGVEVCLWDGWCPTVKISEH